MPPTPFVVAHLGSSFPVGVVRWSLAGLPRLTAIAKLTWTLGEGASPSLSGEHEPLLEGIEGRPGHPGDFVPRKGAVDVLVRGAAIAAPLVSDDEEAGAASDLPWPHDFDCDFSRYNVAAPEGRLATVGPGSRVEIAGLGHHGERGMFELPELAPRLVADRGDSVDAVALRCDTISVDLGARRVHAVWRGEINDGGVGIDRLIAALGTEELPVDEAVRARLPRAHFAFASERGREADPSDPEMLRVARLEACEYAAEPLLPLPAYAAISAAIAEGRPPRAETLSSHGLSEDDWMIEERAWTERMGREASNGDVSLAAEYGELFVAAQDRLADPLEDKCTLRDYAETLAELEATGDQEKALHRRGLTTAGFMRIDRRLGALIQSDASASAQFEHWLASARAANMMNDDDEDEDTGDTELGTV